MLILTLLTATVVIALLSGLSLWYDRPQRVSGVQVDGDLLLEEEREPVKPVLGPLADLSSVVEASSLGTDGPELILETGALAVSFEGAIGDEVGTGIAVLDGQSGALLAYHQLGAEDTTLRFPNLPIGAHWLAHCSSEAKARYAYFRRVRVEVRAGLEVQRRLSLETHELTLTLVETETGKVPTGLVVTILERGGDPSWRRALAISPSPDPDDIQLRIQGLGPGDYQLSIPGFQVEGGERISLQVRERTELTLRGAWRKPL